MQRLACLPESAIKGTMPGSTLLVSGSRPKRTARARRSRFVLRSHRLILFTERTVAIVTKAGAYPSHGHLR